eukprot:369064-Alexandrium_andersonii.AAC.1
MSSSSSQWAPPRRLWTPAMQPDPPPVPSPPTRMPSAASLETEEEEEEDADIDPNLLTRAECGEEFAALLQEYKRLSILSAKQACLLAFWASKAGADGDAKKLGFRPGAPSGHYSRHWDAM